MTQSAPSIHDQSTVVVDATINDLVDAVFSGSLDENQARRAIAGHLFATGIHDQVAARSTTGLSKQDKAELAERLAHLLMQKVITPGENGYSLEQGRGKSACGWARQLASAAVASETRKIRRAENRLGIPMDPAGHEFSAAANSALITYDVDDSTAIEEAVEDFTSAVRGARGTDRMFVAARYLAEVFDLVPAIRPDAMVDRDILTASLIADETLALRSLRSWRALVHGTDAAAVDPSIDERVLMLWDDQTEESAERLSAMGADTAHALALAAVSPMPRPAKKALAKFKTVVGQVATGTRRDARWRELSSALVDSYIASQYEAVSQYATMSVDSRSAAITGHTIARTRLNTLLIRAAGHPGAPLGNSPVQVQARLAQLASTILNDSEPILLTA
ncbi:hypothetical protein [Nocardioides pakistanensis]